MAVAVKSGAAIPAGEVRFRTATGRAYYAAFVATRDAMQAKHGIAPESFIPHDYFTQTLAGYKLDPDVQEIGVKLDRMRLRRIDADYHPLRPHSEQRAQQTIEDAQRVLDLLPATKDKLPRIEDTRVRY